MTDSVCWNKGGFYLVKSLFYVIVELTKLISWLVVLSIKPIVSSCRIWRIRCTLLSRGDVRCWRISTTPEAPSWSTSISLLTSIPLPSLPSISFHHHPTVQLYWSPFCFLTLVHFAPSLPWCCRVTEWHDCNFPFIIPLLLTSSSCFALGASVKLATHVAALYFRS